MTVFILLIMGMDDWEIFRQFRYSFCKEMGWKRVGGCGNGGSTMWGTSYI